LGERKVAAAPTSARICCAEPRHFGQAVHSVVVRREELGHLLIGLIDVMLDQSQFGER
jgi:hypothetical protein